MQRLTKDELIELVLQMQHPEKTSRTSSKPPSTDRKERREQSPGGAKPRHEGHSRVMAENFDRIVEHRPDQCSCCGTFLAHDLAAVIVSEHDTIELPDIKPFVERHHR